MAGVVTPAVKPLVLCDAAGSWQGKTELRGLFTTIRAASFPHIHPTFTIFVQLSQGLGDVSFYFDIIRASDGEWVHTTNVRSVAFPKRSFTQQIAMRIDGLEFDTPGLYVAEMFCNNSWVADGTFELEVMP